MGEGGAAQVKAKRSYLFGTFEDEADLAPLVAEFDPAGRLRVFDGERSA